MIAYRKKTRSDEQIPPYLFRAGLIVWVAGPNGREEYICTDVPGECLPRADYFKWKQARTEERVRANRSRPRTKRRSTHGDLAFSGIGGIYL